MRAAGILLALIATLLSCRAAAAPSVYFLSVGSSRYLDPAAKGDHGFQKLDGARNGATALSDRLSEGGARFGIVLTSPQGSIVGLADFNRALGDILQRIKTDNASGPILIVYIAAHGISDGFGWNHFSVPGDLTYRGDPDKLPPDQLADQAIYTAAVVDRLNKAHVHYIMLLDTCYEGKASVFESPVLSATASQNIGDIAKALRFANEFHQNDPVLFSTTPGTSVPVAPDPTDPASNSMGPLARRLVMLIDASAAAKRAVTVADIVNGLRSSTADPLTHPAVTNATTAPWWTEGLYVPQTRLGAVDERSGTATTPRLCCVADLAGVGNAVPMLGTITLTSAPGEFVTDGRSISLSVGITLERPDPTSMTLRVPDPDGDWELDFTSDKPLVARSYAHAERAGLAANGRPGLAVTGHGHACNEVRGEFAITSLPSTTAGFLTVHFSQFCDEVPAALTGNVQIRVP